MASFFSKLFGRSGGSAAPAKIAEETEAYNDLTLVAAPIPEGGQYRLAGRIEKRDGDRILIRSFIRADLFSSRDDTVASTFRKAKQIADQHGTSLFSDGMDNRQV
jgi:hypothetical protein